MAELTTEQLEAMGRAERWVSGNLAAYDSEQAAADVRVLLALMEAQRMELATVERERDAGLIALARLVHEGDAHEDQDCPGDDTCACVIAAAVNAALPVCPTDNCGAMWPCKRHAPETYARWTAAKEGA